MTLSLAWVRRVESVEELVFATDSRLRFGRAWDCCPKVFPLARGDAAICFAGSTLYGYPLLLQIRAAVESHRKSLCRAQDLTDFKGHLLRLMNDMCSQIHDPPHGKSEPEQPNAQFLLGGFSWKLKRFVLWTLHFDAHLKRFTFRPGKKWKGIKGNRILAITGDSIDQAKTQLISLLRKKNKLTSGDFDMEPFEVLRDIIRAQIDPSIGGPPQLVKVQRHLNATPYGVYWPKRAGGRITLFGRPLLKYEHMEYLAFDPDSLEIVPQRQYVDSETW